jgi:hypothetical protein
MGRHITKDVWDKLRLARAAGASFAELSRQSGINRNTILSYAARHGWSHQIATARQQADSGKPDVTDIVQRVLAEKGRAAKLHIADILLQVLAEEKKRGIVIEDASDLEKIENIRSSLFPEPQQIDVRRMQMQLGVNLSGGLSEEALAEIERLCKIL